MTFDELVVRDPDPPHCWRWRGEVKQDGTPIFKVNDHEQVEAQRWAYEQFVGPVPHGQTFRDYTCRTMGCCNPDHVRAV
jgi:hypothetical protein